MFTRAADTPGWVRQEVDSGLLYQISSVVCRPLNQHVKTNAIHAPGAVVIDTAAAVRTVCRVKLSVASGSGGEGR